MTHADTLPISVVILTKDEEDNLPGCIQSCVGLADIHVLDSGSTDTTAEIATAHGAQVWVNPFESFGAQRNWAIDNIDTTYKWILHLDADEHLTSELLSELKSVIESDPSDAGFYIPSKLMFMNRWLKRCGGYPNYQMRLFHRERMRFHDHGHGQRELTDGTIGTFREGYLHYAFSKGVANWIAKHNIYSSQEVAQVLKDNQGVKAKDLLSLNRITRRRAMKQLSFRLPMRGTLRMVQILILQRGMLDGKAGFMYARLMSIYERMIEIKYRMQRRGSSEGL